MHRKIFVCCLSICLAHGFKAWNYHVNVYTTSSQQQYGSLHIRPLWWTSRHVHGPLARYVNLRMRQECWERFPRHRHQRKPLVSDPGMHHGTCVAWCTSGLLTRGGGENVPGIPGACETRNFTYLARGPLRKDRFINKHVRVYMQDQLLLESDVSMNRTFPLWAICSVHDVRSLFNEDNLLWVCVYTAVYGEKGIIDLDGPGLSETTGWVHAY